MRKIVQITSAQVQEGAVTQCEMYVIALCDDGTLWRINNRDIDTNGFWFRVPDIQQDDEALPPTSAREGFAPSDLFGPDTCLWTFWEGNCRAVSDAADCMGCVEMDRLLVEAIDVDHAIKIAANPTAIGVTKNYATVLQRRIAYLSDQIPF